jgi:hypothetical protein
MFSLARGQDFHLGKSRFIPRSAKLADITERRSREGNPAYLTGVSRNTESICEKDINVEEHIETIFELHASN